MSILHPHWQDPETFLPLETALWWRDHKELFLRALTQPKYRGKSQFSDLSGNLIIYPPKCNRMENEMNGRKPQRHGTGSSNGNGKSLPFKWINVTLTAEDIATLERETASLEQLALAYIELGVLGLGLSIKYDSVRKHFSVSIYGSDMANNNQPCGISGSATELRDALLVSLYRFNTCLQGSFDGSTTSDATVQSGRFK